MCRGTWKEPSGNFFGNRKWDFQIIIKKTFPEILYNEYGKWKYPSAEKVPETAKDDTCKNKTSPSGAGGMETEIGNCKQGIIRKIFCKSVIRLRKPSSGEKTGRKISWD